jgi:methyl coenzyme M reductase subunit C
MPNICKITHQVNYFSLKVKVIKFQSSSIVPQRSELNVGVMFTVQQMQDLQLRASKSKLHISYLHFKASNCDSHILKINNEVIQLNSHCPLFRPVPLSFFFP